MVDGLIKYINDMAHVLIKKQHQKKTKLAPAFTFKFRKNLSPPWRAEVALSDVAKVR